MPIQACNWLKVYKYVASLSVSALGVAVLNFVRICYPHQPDDTLLLAMSVVAGLAWIFLGVFMFRGVKQGKL